MRLLKSLMARGFLGTTRRGETRARVTHVWKLLFPMTALSLAAMLVLVALPSQLFAAPPARFIHLSVDQGLSQSTVQAVLQDHVGFLWFGTEEGLNRYDGYTFVVFRHDARDPRSLPDDIISALHEDRQGHLWVGTEAGLCLFDRRTEIFTQVSSIRVRVNALEEDADGTVWVATEGAGLFERNPTTGVFVQYTPDPKDPASLGSRLVSALFRDHSGRLWIGTSDAGVDRLEKDGKRFVHYRHDPHNPQSVASHQISAGGLAEDQAGNIWVATYGGGLNVLDQRTGNFRHYQHRADDPRSLRTDLVMCVLVDRTGTIWIGTDGAGVEQYDATSGQFVALVHDSGDPASLSQNVIRTIYQDVQGNLWVGTYLGGANLFKRQRSAFAYFTQSATGASSLGDPSVASFLEDKDGHIWVGTEGGWVNRFERQTGTFVRYRFRSEVPGGSGVLALHQDRHGHIWVGTYLGGLGRFDAQRGTFAIYKHRPNDPGSLASDEVWAIAEDQAGVLWVGTNESLDRFDPSLGKVTAHYYATRPGAVEHANVRALLFDRQGNLWVGTLTGLYLLPSGSQSFVSYLHNDSDPRSLSNDGVVALHEDRQGQLWVGTLGGGLNRFDAKTSTFTSYKEFPSNAIYGIQEESSGRLWLSTNHGLSRFDPATRSIENFDLANGLQSLQFRLGASLETSAGHILFGSANGFYDFDPETVKLDTYAPPVVFTALRIFNEPAQLPDSLSTLDQVTLSSRDKIFSIAFAALDYTLPRRNHYAYVMEGLSDRWIQLGEKREVTFTNLDPGKYVLRVKASNSDGVWSDASAVPLRVVILPPFWRTGWFYALCILSVVFTGTASYRLRTRRLRARSEALAGLVDERTKDLLAENTERKRAEQELLRYKEGLEEQVAERTAELSETNEQLRREMTERERAEEARREAEQKYRSIVEEAVIGIFQSTPSGRYLSVNPAMARMFGYDSPQELLASIKDIAVQEYVDPKQREEFMRSLEQQGAVHDFECQVYRKDGSKIWISINARAIRKDGAAVRYEGTNEDITERKLLEEQLRQAQKMEAIGRLAGGIAHDFNNLLTIITGSSELLQESITDQALRKRVETIRKAGEKAASLTRQLLTFSRRQVLQPRILNLNEVLSDLGQMLRRLVSENIELKIFTDSRLGLIRCDPSQIEQVVLNLVINGRDAMPEGGRLAVETANATADEVDGRPNGEDQQESYVRLTVSDTGVGMDEETQSHVFEPFFTTKETNKGTGLGLATVYGIVQQAGGHISVQSAPGQGSTFHVYFPRAEGVSSERHVPAKRRQERGSETVLLVEDNDEVRQLGCDILRGNGYSVLLARDGREAGQIFREHHGRIDLVITDMVMPQMGGRELASTVTSFHPTTRVLFMSGYAYGTLDQNEELDADMAFIQKPFSPESLLRKVREILDAPPDSSQASQ
jgi:PAS domain S-box-containing protein